MALSELLRDITHHMSLIKSRDVSANMWVKLVYVAKVGFKIFSYFWERRISASLIKFVCAEQNREVLGDPKPCGSPFSGFEGRFLEI